MPMVDIDWLKDHVEVPEGLTYEQLAKDLVKVGLEEEEIHTSQVTGPIVVGYVVDATPEPQKNGKIINWCHVDVGDEYNETDENGNSFYVSSFFVDNSGNVYLSDWQSVYIYDQDGNKKTTVDLGENGGDLCELKATAKEVWEQADFVSVHLPVVPSTEHSIGREQFSWMKPTASFINCARGALIKENELVECLKDGTLFQAGLDVFEHEPIQESSRELFNLDNVIMTPHMAATTEQSVLNCCTSVANDIVAVCNGQEPQVKAQKPKF